MADERTILIGEDLLDPYGGAFKVTKGLSTAYPDRVFTTPISEAAIVGIAGGAALRGARSIVEIMFGDFITLATDQIVNHASKFPRMYGRRLDCALIIRAPMGGYRGYGPTHSQSLEKLYLGIPGLTVTAFSPVHDQSLLWRRMFDLKAPVLYVENKSLYGQRMMPAEADRLGGFKVASSKSYFPTLRLNLTGFEDEPDLTIVTYGGMTPLAMEAAKALFVADELSVDVVVFSQLAPLSERDLSFAMQRSRRFLILEEGTQRAGWGAEVSARMVQNRGGVETIERYGALDTVIPNSADAEGYVLPSLSGLLDVARRALQHG
jgi:2-oxoisovalerate dehydrogenase E1 component